ncbi:hypothetical protein AVEN_4786-1 [Araneus ventricosus]|uniref:Uncharacterized protein n=1 Tax=Araneus ventricosus TaxID=182803 RepID=A0A4Y2VHP1_ARAVE|nr:hypothetical protein AVEN_4786-1 [Araneus ventricosus]
MVRRPLWYLTSEHVLEVISCSLAKYPTGYRTAESRSLLSTTQPSGEPALSEKATQLAARDPGSFKTDPKIQHSNNDAMIGIRSRVIADRKSTFSFVPRRSLNPRFPRNNTANSQDSHWT